MPKRFFLQINLHLLDFRLQNLSQHAIHLHQLSRARNRAHFKKAFGVT
jgi:hypothetical protein